MPVHEEISLISTLFNVSLLILKIVFLYISSLLGVDSFITTGDVPTTKSSLNQPDNNHLKTRLVNAKDINEIVETHGYKIREHVVTTRDGYLLVIHKLEKIQNNSYSHQHHHHISSTANLSKIVYFHHGLMTNSELFVLGTNKYKTLPYLLVDLGYEVWLGNNRGNKYSRKHLKLSASDPKFWDFSLDEYSYYDIPDSLTYIKNYYHHINNNTSNNNNNNHTGSPTVLSSSTSTLTNSDLQIIYIGFSQGCSQFFASLSLYPQLNSHIKMFIGLSPAIIPQNLNHPIFKLLVNQAANDNSFLFSLFGRRAIMPSVSFWYTIFGPSLYEKVVDKSLQLLFGWTGANISQSQKEIGYPHMFSNSSVKSLLHWFQIIKAGRFQMFDETCCYGITKLSCLSHKLKQKGNRVAPFPIADHLDVPMVLFYGDNDILVDINKTKNLIVDNNHKMQDKLELVLCPGYEHMDTLWGENVYQDVFKPVLERLEKLEFSFGYNINGSNNRDSELLIEDNDRHQLNSKNLQLHENALDLDDVLLDMNNANEMKFRS